MKLFKRLFIVSLISVLLLFVIGQVFAVTSPSLGAADSFVVLGATAVTNVPTSVITGDVGLSPAAGTNYAGLTVTEVSGTIYAVDPTGPAGAAGNNKTLVDNAQLDNKLAFDRLSAGDNAACTLDYGAITKDLSGETLVPGIYCANAFTLTNATPLILDNSTDPTGIWIFRTTSAAASLTTTPGVGASVQFSSRTANSSCNVWWKVASSATIGSGTRFIGNILALTSISLGTNATLEGRAFAQTGAVTLDQNTITYPICVFPTPTKVPTRGPTSTPSLPGLPGTGSGSVILNEVSPWSLLLIGGVLASALVFGMRSLRKSDHLKK